MPCQGKEGEVSTSPFHLSLITLSTSQIPHPDKSGPGLKKVKPQARLILGEHLPENTWYLLVITIVSLDSFRIYVNNSFILLK